jgi:glucokinase
MNSTTATPPRFLGLEIGGTKLQLGLGRGDGTIDAIERRHVSPERGAEGIRAQIVEMFEALRCRFELRDDLGHAIGIGFGGPVDAARGVVTVSHQIDGWAGFPLVDWVRDALKIDRAVLQNDADTAALGEARFGAGMGRSPVLYVNSGSGIGGGLVIDGRIYPGSGHGAVEIGHLRIDLPGETHRSGSPILEEIASGWAIDRAGKRAAESDLELLKLAGGDLASVDARIVALDALRDADGAGAGILRRANLGMGIALAHAVTLLAPRRVVLGGGVSLMDNSLWLDPIRRIVDERVFPPFRGRFDIVTASLGESVVLHGALALAADADAEETAVARPNR